MKKIQRLILSPEKSYNLPMYAAKLASQYERHSCKEPKSSIPKYTTNVVYFLDVSTSEGEETPESSSSEVSMTKSIAT